MATTRRTFYYNFEKVSIKDIIKFIEDLGYKLEYVYGPNGLKYVEIKNIPIKVKTPNIKILKDSNFHISASLSGAVWWRLYSNMYYSKKSIESGKYDEKNEELYKEHEKLFMKLKRKFQMNKSEHPKAIKDLDWLEKQPKKKEDKSKFKTWI